MVFSGAWGKLIHEKNQKSKISWHCPFKQTSTLDKNQVLKCMLKMGKTLKVKILLSLSYRKYQRSLPAQVEVFNRTVGCDCVWKAGERDNRAIWHETSMGLETFLVAWWLRIFWLTLFYYTVGFRSLNSQQLKSLFINISYRKFPQIPNIEIIFIDEHPNFYRHIRTWMFVQKC